jgi:hypothetical protein
VISQLYHAERAAARMCAWLGGRIGDANALLLLRRQAADEDRHTALYAGYLAELGDVAPMDPAVAAAIDRTLDWDGPPEAVVAVLNIVLEGESVALHGGAIEVFRCPVLGRIARAVRQDEARHVAFGRAYLAKRLPALPVDAHFAILRHVRTVWEEATRSTIVGGPLAGVARRAVRAYMDERWPMHVRTLTRLGLRAGGAA